MWTSARALLQALLMSFQCTSSQMRSGPKFQQRLYIQGGPACKAHAHSLARSKGSPGRLPSPPFRLVHLGSPCLWPGGHSTVSLSVCPLLSTLHHLSSPLPIPAPPCCLGEGLLALSLLFSAFLSPLCSFSGALFLSLTVPS